MVCFTNWQSIIKQNQKHQNLLSTLHNTIHKNLIILQLESPNDSTIFKPVLYGTFDTPVFNILYCTINNLLMFLIHFFHWVQSQWHNFTIGLNKQLKF